MQKKLGYAVFAVLMLIFISSEIKAQEVHEKDTKVSEEAKSALDKLYPAAKGVEWFKVNRDHEAEFLDNNKSVSILFDRKGNVINKKTEIDFNEYPDTVKTAIKQHYVERGFKPLSYMKRTEKDQVIYETLLVKGRELIVVKFSAEGKFISHVQLAKTLPLDYFPTF